VGFEQGGGEAAANSPVDCWLARGRILFSGLGRLPRTEIRTGRRRSRSQQSGGLLASPRENPFSGLGRLPRAEIRTGRRRSRSQQSGGLLASPRENPFFRFGKAPEGRNSNRAAAKPQPTVRWTVG